MSLGGEPDGPATSPLVPDEGGSGTRLFNGDGMGEMFALERRDGGGGGGGRLRAADLKLMLDVAVESVSVGFNSEEAATTCTLESLGGIGGGGRLRANDWKSIAVVAASGASVFKSEEDEDPRSTCTVVSMFKPWLDAARGRLGRTTGSADLGGVWLLEAAANCSNLLRRLLTASEGSSAMSSPVMVVDPG